MSFSLLVSKRVLAKSKNNIKQNLMLIRLRQLNLMTFTIFIYIILTILAYDLEWVKVEVVGNALYDLKIYKNL